MKTLGFVIFFAAIGAHAENVFYNEEVRIASVDCQKGELVTADRSQTKLKVRTQFPARPDAAAAMCGRLATLADGKKTVTLLTVPLKKLGDYISEQEVIGFVDVDYVIAVWDRQNVNKVFRDSCGNDTRSSQVCVWVADDKSTYVGLSYFSGGTRMYSTVATAEGLSLTDNSEGEVTKYNLKVTGTGSSTMATLERNGSVDEPPFKLRKIH